MFCLMWVLYHCFSLFSSRQSHALLAVSSPEVRLHFFLSTTPLCSRYRRLHTYITTNDGSIVISFASHNFLGAGWAGSSVFSAPPINDRVIVETVLRIYCDRCNQLRCSIFTRAVNGSMELREISQCLVVKLGHLSKNVIIKWLL